MESHLKKLVRFFVVFALLAAMLGSPMIVTPVHAAGITVNTTNDELNSNGLCSLREAITNANADDQSGSTDCVAGSGADTITLPVGTYLLSIFGTNEDASATGDLDITDSVTINGAGYGTSINQNGSDRIMHITGAYTVNISGVTLAYGSVSNLFNDGGGIYNNGGTITINNSMLYGNSAHYGGGIFNLAGIITISNSSFILNSTTRAGGGIFNNDGTITISNSTFSGNNANNFGGGGIVSGGPNAILTITNSTFYNNKADSSDDSDSGGGILNYFFATLTISNSTFSGNSANMGGSGISDQGGTVTLKNTIVANNLGAGGNCSGTITNGGNNLQFSGAVADSRGVTITTADPMLGPLANNGGATETFALLPSSPALDAGDNSTCAASDQRGVTRPQGSSCDIGAFESNAQPGPTFVVNTDEDTDDGSCDAYVANITDCTLREAIHYANTISGADTIIFENTLGTATIVLSGTLPSITDANGTTIDGGGDITISGANSSRIFEVASVPLALSNLTVANGYCSLCSGGGVLSTGSLTITNSTFYGNVAGTSANGGAISSSGTLVIVNSTFSGNSAFLHGGGIESTSTLTITNSTFSGNSAGGSGGGGGIISSGTSIITNSTFSGNSAAAGGGVYTDGTSTITNSTFSENTATGGTTSGDIYQANNPSTLNLYNSILANSIGGNCFYSGGTVLGNNNLIEDASSACGFTNGVDGNIIGSDPNLGLLTGSPGYFPLNTGSPAINAGNNTICAASPVNNESQNGVTRPNGANCDIGSVEKLVTATFADVPTNAFGWAYIESIYFAGITGGCTTFPLNYCPNNSVTRASMAIFLLRGIHSSSYTPPAATGTVFNDVPLGSFGDAWIEQFVAEGITAGCGGNNYCPSAPVTRASMAIFLLRAKYGSGYTPPAATGTEFTDVPLGSFADAWIEQLVAEGITGGCGGGNYCPNASVTRSQMAIFIQRTFNLTLP